MTKIFINPGHSLDGNPDPGATYNGYKEHEIASKIAHSLSNMLNAEGFETLVYQQKNENTKQLTANQQLNKVATKANTFKADLFLSIHLNASTNCSAKGTETLYSNGSSKGKQFAEYINDEMIKPFENYSFNNRGAKLDVRNLYVLRATNMPASLVEIGFISNISEAKFIDSHIIEISERLFNAIMRYFGIDKNAKKSFNFRLEQVNDKFNCYVNDKLMLKANTFDSCIAWIILNYRV